MDASGPAPCPNPLPSLERETGSLGSEILVLRGGEPRILDAVTDILSEQFRKTWRDLSKGIAVLMAPSQAHAVTTGGTLDLVRALCDALGIAVVTLRDATTPAREDAGRKAEPDESFLLGTRAERFLRIRRRQGVEAALDDLDNAPADLVVEVEHTRHDAGQRETYRAAGVRELWELANRAAKRQPAIFDLQSKGGPSEMGSSLLVPGVRAERLHAAARVLHEIGGLSDFVRADERGEPVAKRLLEAAGVAAPAV